jgi:predicted membrane protein
MTIAPMNLRNLLPATAAILGALAIAAPVATADTAPSQADVCASVNAAGSMAILGPYGPLGDYGPNGARAGQPNPAAACGGPISFALPGQTVGSFVTSNLSLFGQSSGIPAR